MSGGQHVAVWCIDGAWAAWLVIWVALSRRVKRVVQQESVAQRLGHLVPMAVAAGLMIYRTPGGGTWLETPLLARAAWMVFAGGALVLAGLGFAVWARLVLAENWSGTVTLKLDHELIERGPYRLARHPIYTGLLGAMLGNAVAIDEIRAALAFAVILAAFLQKMQTEEAFMAQAFGARYADYRRRVPALVPGWRS